VPCAPHVTPFAALQCPTQRWVVSVIRAGATGLLRCGRRLAVPNGNPIQSCVLRQLQLRERWSESEPDRAHRNADTRKSAMRCPWSSPRDSGSCGRRRVRGSLDFCSAFDQRWQVLYCRSSLLRAMSSASLLSFCPGSPRLSGVL
jgi:hypothetical protein